MTTSFRAAFTSIPPLSFDSLGLCEPLLRAISEQGYTEPSPIQAQAIPAVLSGRDVMAAAQTGTGKTAGFTLPLLEMLRTGPKVKAKHARTLVLTPTRELAAQVGANVAEYGKHLPMRSTVVFGGVGINPQISKLRHGVDVLIATPGRLLDLHGQGAVSFKELEVLVLDEADRMLDMGFIHDIKRILRLLPQKRQTLMFSATFSNEIKKLANGLVNDPVLVEVSPPNSTVDKVTQWICPVDKSKKPAALAHMIHEHNWQQVLIFSRTKHGANRLARFLESKGIQAAAIHGNKSQNARTQALAGFKSGKVRALVATDIAARGLDIDQLPQVVNVDLPNVPEDYVHRIGRTGRAGASGQAVSLVSADEAKLLFAIERLIGKVVPREYHDEFYPEHELPNSPAPGKRPSGGGGGGGGRNGGGQNKPRKPQGGGGKGNSGQNRGRGGGGNAKTGGDNSADPNKKPPRRRRRRRPSGGGGGQKPA